MSSFEQQHCPDLLPELIALILAHLPPHTLPPYRSVSKSFRTLLDSTSFATANLRHYIPPPNPSQTSVTQPTLQDLQLLHAREPYPKVYTLQYMNHVTSIEWGWSQSNRYSPTRLLAMQCIPPALSLLPTLVHLNLNECGLVGVIPERLGNLVHLQTLNLSFNKLQGGIPASLSQCRELEEVYLSHNLLSGGLPKELGVLSKLKCLVVSFNEGLAGEVPEEFAGLRGLEYFYAQGTGVGGGVPGEWEGVDVVMGALAI
ncbi:hypothetical protein HDU98_005156 [Podochytrium sp. JEL0797]|nr:hypothetical protein HDU98_005156 [Podochytrium sp. JEL0797]